MTNELPMRMTEQEALGYLDRCIERWRDIRDGKTNISNDLSGFAPYYIDAFQCVRLALFGALKE